MLRALAILLFCQLLGETVTRTFNWPLPGPVVGLAILAVLLTFAWSSQGIVRDIETLSDNILGALGLLFVPAGVGVVQQLGLLGAFWLQIAITLLLSSLITLLVTVGAFVLTRRLLPIAS